MNLIPARISRDNGRVCAACDAPLERKRGESAKRFRDRETCGQSCANRVRSTWITAHEMIIHNTHVRATTGCWEWQGSRDRKGYGRAAPSDGETLAHRISYAEANGQIPAGLHVLHKCDNPPCCNPEHLFLGSNLDNVIDRVTKGRSACLKGEKNPNYRTGKFVKAKRKPPATIQRYWEWLKQEYPTCVCGWPVEQIHHIMHVNGQRISKDDWLVIGLCHNCHNGDGGSVHSLGGEVQFLNVTAWDLVQLSVLRRHNFEVRHGAHKAEL